MSGGLAFFWHESYEVEILDKEEWYIDALVRKQEGADRWRITCVNGEPHVENRYLMWEKLQCLKNTSDLPWLVVGILTKLCGTLNIFLLHQGENHR